MRAALKAKVRAHSDAVKYERDQRKRALRDFILKMERNIERLPSNASAAQWLLFVEANLAHVADQGGTHWTLTSVSPLTEARAKSIAGLESLQRHMGDKAMDLADEFSEAKKRIDMAVTAALNRYAAYWRNRSDVPIATDELGLHFDWSE